MERWFIQIRSQIDQRVVAEIYDNRIWHTFDKDGMGGENWSGETMSDAIRNAFMSAVSQGFISPSIPFDNIKPEADDAE